MRIDRSYLGNQNTYAENNPKCIVVHNTDNFAAGADARAHARAQHDGNFQNISAHYYVDDGDTAYQAAPHSRGCWHVGINYGGKNLFQQYGNKNSIGVEMCVQAGYNYEKAFENTAALVREIMRETGIPLERVYRHYDICSKYCPSQIMNRGDWAPHEADDRKRYREHRNGNSRQRNRKNVCARDLSGADSGPQHPSGTGCGQQDCRNDPGSGKLHGDGNPEHKLGTASLRGRLGQLPYSVLPLCRSRKRKIGRDIKAIRKDSRRGRNLGRKSDAPSAGTFRHIAGWKNQQSAGRQPEIL